MIHSIKSSIRIFQKLYGPYRRQIGILIALGFLSGIFEGIGIGALVPLFSLVLETGGIESNRASQLIGELFSYFHVDPTIVSLLVFVSILFFLKAFVLLWFGYVEIRIIADYTNKTRSDLYTTTLFSSWMYLLQQRLGYLENVLTIDTSESGKMLRSFSGITLAISSMIIYAAVALTISFRVTLITLAVGGILLLFLKPLVRRIQVYARKLTSLRKKIAHRVNESISGLKTVKALGAEEGIVAEGKNFFERWRDIHIRSFMVSQFSKVFIQPVSVLFIAFIFYISYLQPNFDIAAFVVVVYLIERIFIHIDKIQKSFMQIGSAIPYVANVFSLQNDLADKGRDAEKNGAGNDQPFAFERELEFRNVSFSYNEARPILSGITMRIQKGDIVGIVGHSGSGKTTIVDLLLRLFQPTGGSILADGRDIGEINIKEWQKFVGYVPQDVFLRNDTIEQNISFFSSDIAKADIEEAVEKAHLLPVIEKLSDGLKTEVGERGVALSGGERQRIALARALARKPKMLILDEATSALDAESEASIQRALEELRGGVTIIIVAHRLSTIMIADRVIAVEGGRIIEEGAPKSLLSDPHSYLSRVYHT